MVNEIKLIHTADLHLGMTFKLLGEKSKLYRNECQDVFTNIIDLCLKEKVDGLLIAGDLFDTPNPQKSLVKFIISEFERLKEHKIYVFISSGNHDPYKKGSLWLEYKFPSNVIIFDSNDLDSKEMNGLTIYGLAYTNDIKEPLKGFKADNSDNFKVGVIHGSTTDIKWEEEPEAGYRRITKSDIENSNLDYIALGHFHDVLEIKSKTKCLYSGSPQPLTFKNKKESYVLLISYKQGKVSVKPIKMNTKSFDSLEIDCTNFESDNEVRKILEKNKGDDKILRVILNGSPSLDLNLDLELLEKEFESKYFFIKMVDNIHLPTNLVEDETIRGNFIKLIQAEIKKEKDPENKKRLENALRLGVGYLDKKL